MTEGLGMLRRLLAPFPRVLQALQEGREHARWLRLRAAGEDAGAAGPYGEEFWSYHDRPRDDWAGAARVLLRRVPARSWVDVGCGDGKLLAALRDADPSLRLQGFDYAESALSRARALGLPVERLDVVSLSPREVEALAARLGEFDAAVCLEVAEHLPRWRVDRLLRLLSACPAVVFSAAPPGQGGSMHLTERPAAWWEARFRRHGLVPSDAEGALRAELAALDLPRYYADNVRLYVRGTA